MKHNFKRAYTLIKLNRKALIRFEILYKLFLVLVFSPSAYGILRISANVNRKGYVASNILMKYVFNPVVLLCLFLIALVTAIAMLLEMNALIICFHASYRQEKITALQMLKLSVNRVLMQLKWRNWTVIIFVVLIVPLTNTAITSSYISKLQLPEFISDFINANTTLNILTQVLLLLLILLSLQCVFALHFFALKETSFIKAARDSRELMKKHFFKTFFMSAIWQFLYSLIYFAGASLLCGFGFLLIWKFANRNMQHFLAQLVIYIIGVVFMSATGVIAQPVSFSILSALFYSYCEEKGYEIPAEDVFHKTVLSKKQKIGISVLGFVIVCSIGVSAFFHIRELNLLENSSIEIMAHRGNSILAPENSMPAFESAMDVNADWIELDVHQTKDGVIVVNHDESIKRITGVNKKVWELTYEELEQYDAGSWFAPIFSNVRVATLDEVLKACKGKIKLNIELKPTGHEPDFEQHVIDIVKENQFEEECELASLDADTLVRVKELAPELKTIYITTVAIGNVSKLTFADAFSVEESFVNRIMVNEIKRAGKKIYVWTVNNSENGKKMRDLGVDSIITDDPVGMRSAIENTSPMPLFDEIVDELFPLSDGSI